MSENRCFIFEEGGKKTGPKSCDCKKGSVDHFHAIDQFGVVSTRLYKMYWLKVLTESNGVL